MSKTTPTDISSTLETTATTDAFKAGVLSAEPNMLTMFTASHHRDVVLSDVSAAVMREQKALNDGPQQMAGTMELHTAESLCAAVNTYGTERTRIFADRNARAINAVFDYLSPKGEITEDSLTPGWGQFRAAVVFNLSRKLKEWQTVTEWVPQPLFAQFLEDHIDDVITPSGADLLALATDLEANSTGSFKGKMNLQNGDCRLEFQSETVTSVEVPKELILGIPLFEHGDKYKVTARLRFQMRGGLLVFRLLFNNLEDAIEQEFERITQEIEEKTARVAFRGTVKIPF